MLYRSKNPSISVNDKILQYIIDFKKLYILVTLSIQNRVIEKKFCNT